MYALPASTACTLDVASCGGSSSSIALVRLLLGFPDVSHFFNLAVVHAMQGLALSTLSPGTIILMY